MTSLILILLSMSVSAGWAVLAVLLLRLLLRKSPKWITCLLWAIPALRLMIPVFLKSPFSLIPDSAAIPVDVIQPDTPAVSGSLAELPDAAIHAFQPTTAETASPDHILQIVMIVWAVGLGIMLLYSCISWLRLHISVRTSLRHKGRIYLCDDIKSPFGVLRPRIYIPSGIEETTLQYVIAHETAHLKRLDHLWKPFGYLLLSIYWFHPLFWVAYILLCRDIEQACDEQVLRSIDDSEKICYANALIDCSTHRRMILTCPVAFGEVGVKARIKAVLNYKKPTFWLVLLAMASCAVAGVCFLTDPADPPPCTHRYRGEITLAATCTQTGHETFTCHLCGHSYINTLAQCAHSYGAPTVVQESDCTNHGEEAAVCLDCGFVVTAPLPLAADAHDLHTVTVKEPACGIPGQTKTACTRCSFVEYNDIAALEHSYELTERVEPNCSHSGKEIHTCKLCGDQTKTRLPRNGKHSWRIYDQYVKTCNHCHCIINTYRGNGADILEDLYRPRFASSQPEFPIIWDVAGNRDPLFPGKP